MYVLPNKYKGNLETIIYYCIFGVRKIYTMLLLAQYLLAGVIIAFLLEYIIRIMGNDVSGKERYSMIVLWPIMTIVFIYYFIKGILED